MHNEYNETPSWLDRSFTALLSHFNIETLLVIIILVLTVVSRFYILGARVMSHDEVNHVVPSFDLFQGRGYRHDPVTHGPMQFHLLALSFYILGDSDFSARVPAALFSIATVAFVLFAYRRYLGRTGALIAGFLFLISPYLLFYGRYTRNEAFIGLFGVVLLYAAIRYMEVGSKASLFLVTIVTALHFVTKETSYIYTAQFLLLCAILFLEEIMRAPWKDSRTRKTFLIYISTAFILFFAALGMSVWSSALQKAATGGAEQATIVMTTPMLIAKYGLLIGLGGAVVFGVLAIMFLVQSLGWKEIRSKRTFDMLILIGSLILPQLTAFPVVMVGWNPLDYSTVGLVHTGIFLIMFFVISIALGLWWNWKEWLKHAAVFYAIFIVLYTTFFTNGEGFFTGIIGSLGHWASQQAVERGSQPWYYFVFLQIPVYEYLAAIGTLLAVYFGVRYRLFATVPGISPAQNIGLQLPAPEPAAPLQELDENDPGEVTQDNEEPVTVPDTRFKKLPILFILIYWAMTSLVAFSLAGEKMPWLTVHIALPMLLAAGWGIGILVERIDWKFITKWNGLITVLLLPVFFAALAGTLISLLGTTPPFQGNTLDQLQATSTFIFSFIATGLSAFGILYMVRKWDNKHILSLAWVTFFSLLAILTMRTSYRANYINYDTALEYLVYAHAARGPKDVLAQVEDLSRRLTGGNDIVVAYDSDALYPYWWYLRNYPNHRWFTEPTRDLRDDPIIIVGSKNFGKIEPIVRDDYVKFEYVRLWWPNMDYFNLTWDRVWNAIKDPKMRTAIFDIWLNRDYTLYAQLSSNPDTFKLETWEPSDRMRMYIRKDIISQIWDYGTAPAIATTTETDPYADKMIQLSPDMVIGETGTAAGQLQTPRGVAVGPDGTIYVADSHNNRIQRFSPEGQLLNSWGTFGDVLNGDAPGGTFNEPWDLAVAADGSVFVADTWNHRIQKFTADGQFIKMWGHYVDQGQGPEGFWGPRGIAIDSQGWVYVTDTGNKRVAIFDLEGQFINQFGSSGVDQGQLDEPVGIAVDPQERIFVADTWNQRVQVFTRTIDTSTYQATVTWDVSGWFGQSLDNKPYIDVDGKGNVFVTDPEGYRVLEFDSTGTFIRGWGDYSPGIDGFGLTSGVAVDSSGRIWVSDSANNRLLRFTLP